LEIVCYTSIPAALFAGNLSSLCELELLFITTDLPWRNMVNLTTLRMEDGWTSISQLLDFMESAPRLRKIELCNTMDLTSRGEDGQLVSLASLREMVIQEGFSCPPLLDHLLIPVGAKLEVEIKHEEAEIQHLFPRSLDNLRNLSGVTKIKLSSRRPDFRAMSFTGPSGEVTLISEGRQFDDSPFLFDHLARLDVSKTEWLKVSGDSHTSASVVQALFPMRRLRFLWLRRCNDLPAFVHSLSPQPRLPDAVVCPNLEELVLDPHPDASFDFQSVIKMAESRASRGAKLKAVRITVEREELNPVDVLRLGEHVLHVEWGHEAAKEYWGDGSPFSGG
jgi:hypothetical protein